jgi:hypothetical protein
MIVATWILSLLLIAEFVASPINLWTGRQHALFHQVHRLLSYDSPACVRPRGASSVRHWSPSGLPFVL